MFQTTHLRPKLAERGIVLSDSQVYRLVVDKPERLSLKTLLACVFYGDVFRRPGGVLGDTPVEALTVEELDKVAATPTR